MHRLGKPVLIVLCMLLQPSPSQAEGHAPLFATHDTLQVTIEAPLETVDRERDSSDYYDGKLRFTDSGGELRELDVKLRARGRYRKRPETCGFPPILINVKKKQVDGTLFAGQDKLKLVTHCRDRNEWFEQLLLKEYLAYRMWQEISDYSFGVRLLRIDWIDSERPGDSRQRFGFLIEDEKRLGERLGYQLSGATSVRVSRLHTEQAALVNAFEYMIGNTDFSMIDGPADEVCCHNVVLYESPGGHLPIPYDFDFSGFVNAPYAEPNPRFKLRSVRIRLYRGRCEHNDALAGALGVFREKRDTLYRLIETQPGMTERTRKAASNYLDSFFKVIDNPRRVESRLIRKCV